MKRLWCVILLFPFIARAQSSNDSTEAKGIRFEQGLSWAQVKAKAKAENKYIFMDCYATWCGPCKLMDKETYPQKFVGDFVNARFIAIKVQLDSTGSDNPDIQKWYNDAKSIQKSYQVTAMPTFLFFSPEGKIVHRFSGALPDSLFVRLATHALDTNYQYYTRLEKYRAGKMAFADIPKLADAARDNGYKKLADTIARYCIDNYLLKLNESKLYTENNIYFIAEHTNTSKDKSFDFFYRNRTKIDKVANANIAEGVVEGIITKEEINPRVWPANKAFQENPDWKVLTEVIEKKYGVELAERAVLDAKLRWYNEKKDWPQITKYTIQKLNKFGLDTSGVLGKIVANNIMYLVVFKHSDKKAELLTAAAAMKEIVKSMPAVAGDAYYIDTYASLLYKAGRVQEALLWEEKADSLSQHKDKDIPGILEKMKKHEPTW